MTVQYSIAAELGRQPQTWITPDVAASSRRPTPRPGGAVSRRSRARLRRLAAAAAAAVAAVVSTLPNRLGAEASEPPAGSSMFLEHDGPVLRAMQLDLIYWGSVWTAARVSSPAADQITTAIRTVMAGSYLTGLAQYRGVGRGSVRGSTVVTASDPPAGFTDGQVSGFLDRQLDAGTVPGPDVDNQTVYGVLMPTGVKSGDSGFVGEHNYYTRHGRRIHFLWTADSDSLDSATRILSHEVVESATDPEGSGFRGVAGACSQDGWCEIADVCSATSVLDGVTVLSYWSNQAGGCGVPAPEPRPPEHRPRFDGGPPRPPPIGRPRSTS